MIRLAALLLLPLQANAQSYEFCWTGAKGFHIYGQMIVTPNANMQALLTETDLSAFKIAGFHDGLPIGTWSLADLTEYTAWRLNFDPLSSTFPIGGLAPNGAGQRWNASGQMDDCGAPGFGFNAGNFSQDLCLNNTWLEDSIIDPDVPFLAYPTGEAPPCPADLLLGSLLPALKPAS